MLLDNEKDNHKVHHWIAQYTEEGQLDIVTGYFTIGALAWLSQTVNNRVSQFRLILGDIVNIDCIDNRPLDLLNETLTVDGALALSKIAQEAVAFLKQDKVLAKTLEPNFCHAKIYLFQPENNDDRNKYFITGSSNLTEAGIGLRVTHNVELNLAETGNNNQYKELVAWFDNIWHKPQAHTNKTIVYPDGRKEKIDFKQYLISQIEKIFVQYTPKDIYYKILFELFGNQLLETENDLEFLKRKGRLEDSQIYQSLYEFQQKGVESLIRMLKKYNGAILADAVGLGKTWSALAVIKYFEKEGRDTILFCPKKLEQNWRKYLRREGSRFEMDAFDYEIFYHTDLNEQFESRFESKYQYITNDKPKLIVIDESHNLRNHKSGRYQYLIEHIIKKCKDVKVLLLSATPINNSLIDIRNQFRLLALGRDNGFDESLGIKNLDATFRKAQQAYNEWREVRDAGINEFIRKLPTNFFSLTDALTVARTRKLITGQQDGLNFPIKMPPINRFVTPDKIGNFESFEELFNHFPPMLSGYQPAFYLDEKKFEKSDVIHDEKLRDRFLVKMMYILMVKRLESSWNSFFLTVEKIKEHHQNALDKIQAYQALKQDSELEEDIFVNQFSEDEELEQEWEDFNLGKKRHISLAEIDQAGRLELFKKDLKKDLEYLDVLYSNLQKFNEKIQNELLIPGNKKSADKKLEVLIHEIQQKRLRGENNGNPKVIIFTVYSDTAEYLFNQLKNRGFSNIGLVTGSFAQTSDSDERVKNFEPILERFAPYTKLFIEKEWKEFKVVKKNIETYPEWVKWIAVNDPKTYQKLQQPIDILIATDVLSEGQNLQDADMVINYDIHWNPVRVIQRVGRVDRLGSPNKKIFSVNFWPSDNINNYLDLQSRIEDRMLAMKLAGAEIDESFTERLRQRLNDDTLDQRMRNRMLEQMQTTLEDIEGEKSFGFDDLSLERYRQELWAELSQNKDRYRDMPKGVYSGFVAKDKNLCSQEGIIALMGYPAKKPKVRDHQYKYYELVYINDKGQSILLNQKEILDVLTLHKEQGREVAPEIDQGKPDAIQKWSNSLKAWLASQAVQTVSDDAMGDTQVVAGKSTMDLIQKLKYGSQQAVQEIKDNPKIEDRYQPENFDLIAWLIVRV
jgi:DNA or RNA helicases of superfamily II